MKKKVPELGQATFHPTNFPGVVFLESSAQTPDGSVEKVYYIMYRSPDRRQHFEKVGGSYRHKMTPSKANAIRGDRARGKELPNVARREAAQKAREENAGRFDLNRLWESYRDARGPNPEHLLGNDASRYALYIRDELGRKAPSDLVPLDVERLKRRILDSADHRIKDEGKAKAKGKQKTVPRKAKSAGTVKNVLELLRRLINYGERMRLAPGPGFKIQLPRVNNEKTEHLTEDQATRLLAVLDDWPDVQAAALVRLALYTGMRRGELFRLEWRDVDFERGFIRLREPKGGVDQTIPMNTEARTVLEAHLRAEGVPYVFPGKGGRMRKDAKKAVRAIMTAAGIPETFRMFHGLRHAFASALASSGRVDLYTLQKLLTHKSPQMTQRYAHLRDETLKNAANVAGRIVRAAGKET